VFRVGSGKGIFLSRSSRGSSVRITHSKYKLEASYQILTHGRTASFRIVEHLVVDNTTYNNIVLNLELRQVIVRCPKAAEDKLTAALFGR